ncbi:Sigma 54 interacting domain protein [Catenulispora acidiphila DSM 44928]|uniref:Sigma 54 interacting domain protein n=1 Tax=Catenulispora acidiphila (strain DSM 44928 / JCM 14897 / NBRC 102108 / NRRL B-24433 / ID139908) TaxID=479433 RepID=C7Q6G5_CATAD|nr:ATP-binding protein [Catenulispora acidiphila]ACU74000.1 Sigma 54 interacting domain protein [Catenulispora acidiphila DSM 44928]
MTVVTSDPSAAPLHGRAREQQVLDRLLHDLRAGRSRALVLRGDTGVGKSALLGYLAGQPLAGRVVRTAGVETEPEVAFSALQELCSPLLDRLGRLPAAQQSALATALGLEEGASPGPLLIGLAVLGLFAEAADDEPLVCIVDDVQWLDGMSAAVLAFVARRLDAEAVALVFATADSRFLAGLPELRVARLGEDDARALLDSVLPGPIDPALRDRIIAESQGNPLALVVLSRRTEEGVGRP